MKFVAALLAAAFIAGAGFAVGWSTRGERTTTRTVTTEAAEQSLPRAVERTRAALLRALASRDDETLQRLISSSGFSYTFGPSYPGGAVPYWRHLEQTSGTKPLATLNRILRLPFSLRQGLFVWPFAYGTPKTELTPYERGLLGPLARSYVGDDYYGWRTGIKPDGTWAFYVAGD